MFGARMAPRSGSVSLRLAMKGDEERIRAAGCDGYIAKPMRYCEFLATVATQRATS